jgi:ribonuclease HI
MNNNNIISVFTDGCCINNGKKGAKGGYAVWFSDDNKLNIQGEIVNPTNQRAELTAIKMLMRIIECNEELFKGKQIIIYTDSDYSIKCITRWSGNW